MSTHESGERGTLDWLVDEHRILSSYRCSCGWEGDSPTLHILDVLGPNEQVGMRAALSELVEAVDAHKGYWARVDWGSERCERRILAALAAARTVLSGRST